MKIKKFEAYEDAYPPDDYDYEFGGHAFVLARYKGGWNNAPVAIFFENDEFVPCMVNGDPSKKWQSRSLWIPGNVNSHSLDDFDILKGSDKGIQEFIKKYTEANKFNI
jgi:hypothetical protein